MSERGLCGSCGTVVYDADALLCKRAICDARNVIVRAKKDVRPPQKNPGEVIDYTDSTAGLGDAYDNWTP
jgi:hypothetical protein